MKALSNFFENAKQKWYIYLPVYILLFLSVSLLSNVPAWGYWVAFGVGVGGWVVNAFVETEPVPKWVWMSGLIFAVSSVVAGIAQFLLIVIGLVAGAYYLFYKKANLEPVPEKEEEQETEEE